MFSSFLARQAKPAKSKIHLELFNWHWLAKQITLIIGAAIQLKKLPMLFRLHTFGNDLNIKILGITNNGLHDDRIGGFYTYIEHERLIDL